MSASWLSSQLQSRAVTDEGEESASQVFSALGRNLETPAASALKRFGWDITAAARDGEVDPVVGRSNEIGQTIESLLRRTKNNAVLIGDAGVGKTAIALGLATQINSGKVPRLLLGRKVVALDLASLVAGTRFRGEFEERFKAIIKEVEDSRRQIILFIDELHTVVGAGAAEGALDASNILKPALARGGLQLIGATTIQEYRSHIERDAALERRFQPIMVDEPTVEQTVEILRGLRERYEDHHGLRISTEALAAAAQLSDRYVVDRRMPDKAIDVLDRACAHVVVINHERELSLKAKPVSAASSATSELLADTVDVADVEQVVARLSGAPEVSTSTARSDGLSHLGERLAKQVVGQTAAVEMVALVLCNRADRHGPTEHLRDRRPLGSFVFHGPPGVGKTHTAYALSDVLFGGSDKVLRFDMTQFSDRHSVTRLLGAAPGLVGSDRPGELVEAVRRTPHAVVLLDEVDRAHPDVMAALSPILERGALQDSRGSIASFTETVVVMTMQASPEAINDDGGRSLPADLFRTSVPRSITDRVDAVIEFKPLDTLARRLYLQMLAATLTDRLSPVVTSISLTPRALELLQAQAEPTTRGAWGLRLIFRDRVESLVTTWLAAHNDRTDEHHVVIDADGDHIRVIVEPNGQPNAL